MGSHTLPGTVETRAGHKGDMRPQSEWKQTEEKGIGESVAGIGRHTK
jgi:hypothetical protein